MAIQTISRLSVNEAVNRLDDWCEQNRGPFPGRRGCCTFLVVDTADIPDTTRPGYVGYLNWYQFVPVTLLGTNVHIATETLRETFNAAHHLSQILGLVDEVEVMHQFHLLPQAVALANLLIEAHPSVETEPFGLDHPFMICQRTLRAGREILNNTERAQ